MFTIDYNYTKIFFCNQLIQYIVRTPLPSQVRILAKSLAHSKDVLSKGIFNPSGKGSRTYHENRITTLQPYLDKYSYLLEMRAKPMKPISYY